MKTVRLTSLGRTGNQLFRAAHALALCEQNGYELRMEATPLERIFTLDGWTPKRPDGTEDIVIEGYCQSQADLIYSRADCRRWFKIKPELLSKLVDHSAYYPHAHFRRGDYAGAGYPIISRKAVEAALIQHGITEMCVPVSDESPRGDPEFTGDLSMLPDFYRLMRAPILFRANSTFSYWAGVLSHGRVFSPVITGLVGGEEHDNVPYIEGNSARLAELPFVTDLHLRET